MPALATIVSGDGEVAAVPVLIRRLAATIDPGLAIDVQRPLRASESKLFHKAGELERFVELAARSAPGGAVLVLLDCDDGCPANLGPALQDRASKVRPGLPIEVALARREFESWFLASAESLRGARGLAADLMAPVAPEAIRGAKEWLRNRMVAGRGYSPVIDQPALAAQFDLDLAERRSDSFAACRRRIVRLLTALSRA